ncbi:MAG TPA: hypothetical protein VF529_02125 [Solirubrobacteraceae bacterium]|jgi:hypothetical protein
MNRTLPAVAVCLALLPVAGCGDGTPQRDAPPGTTLDLGGVAYDVQAARELNPSSPDRALFAGVRGNGRTLPADHVWLGVFLQARNAADGPRATARSVEVADGLGHTFRPAPLPARNLFAYRPVTLAPGAAEPSPASPAASSPEQGSLLLFRLPLQDFLANRPLELRLRAAGRLASVQLDV